MHEIQILDFSKKQKDSEVDALAQRRLRALLQQQMNTPGFMENPKLKKSKSS